MEILVVRASKPVNAWTTKRKICIYMPVQIVTTTLHDSNTIHCWHGSTGGDQAVKATPRVRNKQTSQETEIEFSAETQIAIRG